MRTVKKVAFLLLVSAAGCNHEIAHGSLALRVDDVPEEVRELDVVLSNGSDSAAQVVSPTMGTAEVTYDHVPHGTVLFWVRGLDASGNVTDTHFIEHAHSASEEVVELSFGDVNTSAPACSSTTIENDRLDDTRIWSMEHSGDIDSQTVTHSDGTSVIRLEGDITSVSTSNHWYIGQSYDPGVGGDVGVIRTELSLRLKRGQTVDVGPIVVADGAVLEDAPQIRLNSPLSRSGWIRLRRLGRTFDFSRPLFVGLQVTLIPESTDNRVVEVEVSKWRVFVEGTDCR